MKIEEIAKLSGVSRSTVSRVLNDDPNVKDSTRVRVMDVIERENYRPNMVAGAVGAAAAPLLEFNSKGFDVRGYLASITAPTRAL